MPYTLGMGSKLPNDMDRYGSKLLLTLDRIAPFPDLRAQFSMSIYPTFESAETT
jgi:hypothetical protein